MADDNEPKIMTIEEVAEFLRVSKVTVYRLVSQRIVSRRIQSSEGLAILPRRGRSLFEADYLSGAFRRGGANQLTVASTSLLASSQANIFPGMSAHAENSELGCGTKLSRMSCEHPARNAGQSHPDDEER